MHNDSNGFGNVDRNILHGTLDINGCVWCDVVEIQNDCVDTTVKCHGMSIEVLCVYIFCSQRTTKINVSEASSGGDIQSEV